VNRKVPGVWGNVPGGLNAYLNAIENFDPNLATDPHRWIPQGLPYDLIDPDGEATPVSDNVTGYTTGQCFNALQGDVRTISAFRARLIQQTPLISNPQLPQVNALFNDYNY
jgi:hypothetical protein